MDIAVYGLTCSRGREREMARQLLALAAYREWGLERLPEIAREERGKPFFPGQPHLCFNLSHSHGAVVCALHHLPIGVDVERLRPAPRRLAGEMGDEAFFRLWTAREATVKRQGRGLGALLEHGEPDRLCRCVEGLLPGCIVTVCPTEIGPIRVVRIGPEALAGETAGQH